MSQNKDLERKTRNFCAVLYPDCEEHQKALEMLLNNSAIKFVGIEHDRDIYTEDTETHKAGDLKKKHIHLVIELKNPRTRNGFANEFGLNKTVFEPCNSVRAAKRYLLHMDDENKVLYDVSELFGNNCESVLRCIDKPSIDGNIEAPKIADYIEQNAHLITTSEFLSFVCKNRLWSLYRSSMGIFHRMLDEHNQKYLRKEGNDE